MGECYKSLSNPFCFSTHICLRHGNDSCGATDREGEFGLRGAGRLANKETGVFNMFDTQSTGCRKRNREAIRCVKAKELIIA